jgi:biopolymer transport protein ExbD
MLMAFQTEAADSKCDMNVVPLIDVLLVLLIIFMVTAPIVSREILIDLPQPGEVDLSAKPPPPIRLRIDATGNLTWDAHALPRAALMPALMIEAARDPQPLLEVETAPDTEYRMFTTVLASARSAGIEKIGFTE